ncbi:hypothetical protein E27107_200161 [Elizabethkingia anophelis]|nr:hypothetical protein E18064_360163 [Elizabethkingia anophelis]CDN77508.1 hypothetical protein E27107_200161 [Elizabethkingia anophelis]
MCLIVLRIVCEYMPGAKTEYWANSLADKRVKLFYFNSNLKFLILI